MVGHVSHCKLFVGDMASDEVMSAGVTSLGTTSAAGLTDSEGVDLDVLFAEAIERCRSFALQPTEVEKLELYGLLKQAQDGDCILADKPPSLSLDFQAKAKFQAHFAHQGKVAEVAMTEYIMYVERLALHCEHQS